MAVTLPILGLSRWNKNWNVRNSYSDVATATEIRFHFQFPRSPDAPFGSLFEWLFNWKLYKFSFRIISNIANYLKYNYFWDDDGIDNATLRLWKFSDFCSRCTVGVAGDDIMFHILVLCKRPANERWSYIVMSMSSPLAGRIYKIIPSSTWDWLHRIKEGCLSPEKGYKACVKNTFYIS